MNTLASYNEEDEVVQYCEPNVLFVVDEKSFGKGVLYVAESKLFWKNNDKDQIVSVDYKSMAAFGTCNHPTVHEKPCMQIIVDFTYKPVESTVGANEHSQNGDNHEDDSDSANNDGVDENDDEEEEMKSNIKLVPDNPESLTEIYGAFTRVQPLHNSGDDMDSDEDDDIYSENDEFEDYDEDNNDEILMN